MRKQCWTVPSVRSPKGTMVKSKLWKDLYNLTDRDSKKTLELYKIATDSEFIDAVFDMADFDENGQITARSFLSLSGRISEISGDILEKIRSKYSKKNISEQEAVDRIESFNMEESYKKDYVPSISENEDGSVDLDITSRTDASVSELMDKLERNNLSKRIIKRLKDLGVEFDFIGTNKYNGRFSLENIHKSADGLYHLIQISKGGDVNDALVEESAHLATVSLKNNETMQRLINMMNDKNIVSELFSQDEIDSAMLSKNPNFELAGLFVKKILQNKKSFGFDNIMSRVRQLIYKIFSKGVLNDVLTDKYKARMYATQVADGFLYREDNSIEDAKRNSGMNLYSLSTTKTTKELQSTFKRISALRNELGESSGEILKTLFANTNINTLLDDKDFGELSDSAAVAIIGTAIGNLTDNFVALFEKVKEIDFDGDPNDVEMRQYHAAVATYDVIKNLLESYKNLIEKDYFGIEDDVKKTWKGEIEKVTKKLKELDDALLQDKNVSEFLLDAGQKITSKIFKFILGSDSYSESARIVFKGAHESGPLLKIKDAVDHSTAELAMKYVNESDISNLAKRISTVIRHQNNSLDITSQLFYQVVRRVKTNAARKYKHYLQELDEIKKKAKDYKVDVVEFYEKYEDGSFTGDFITKNKKNQYYQDRHLLEDKIKIRYLEELKDSGRINEFYTWTKSEKMADFENYKSAQKDWIDFQNDAFVTIDGERVFSDKYSGNEKYDEIMSDPKKKEIYINILDWLGRLNVEMLTDSPEEGQRPFAYYKNNRIPQFRATLIERWRNNSGINRELYDETHTKELCLNITSNDFGTPLDDLHPEFEDKYSLYIEKTKSIPLYGIKKLEDQKELSTDLFTSLGFYAGMACRFGSTKQLYPTLMIMDRTLSNRFKNIAQNKESISNDNFAAMAKRDRERSIEMLVPESDKKLSRGRRALRRAGGFYATKVLYGSPISGLKNWIGALGVVINDALAGTEQFDAFDVLRAVTRNLFRPDHVVGTPLKYLLMKDISWDKYQQLINRWDAARDPRIKRDSKDGFFKTAVKWITNIAMSNYGVTDESIIAIIYDSYMSSQMVYDIESGKEVSISKGGYKWNGNEPQLKEKLLKNSDDEHFYKLLTYTIEDINDAIVENGNLGKDDIKKDVSDILRSYNGSQLEKEISNRHIFDQDNPLSIMNEDGSQKTLVEYRDTLNKLLESILFTEEDEVKLCEKINDYITTSQGLYGLVNSNEIMSDLTTASFAKIKGWQFGFIQRNLLSNPSALKGNHKEAVLITAAIAMASVFGKRRMDQAQLSANEMMKYRLLVFAGAILPFAINSNFYGLYGIGKKDKTTETLRKYLMDNGWSPEQLNALSFFIVGLLMQILEAFAVKKLFKKVDYKKIGEYLESKARNIAAGLHPKKIKIEEPGWFVKKSGIILENEDAAISKIEKFNEYNPNDEGHMYPYGSSQKKFKNIEIVYSKDELPPLTGDDVPEWVNNSTIIYVEEDNCYYTPQNLKRFTTPKWVKAKYGFFEEADTEEYNEHVLGMRYKEYTYDKTSPWYYILGGIDRLGRGVVSEGESLRNPIRMYKDFKEFVDPLVISAGISNEIQLATYLFNGEYDKALKKRLDFHLNKFFLELDGDGAKAFDVGNHTVTFSDQYKKGDLTEFYQNRTK